MTEHRTNGRKSDRTKGSTRDRRIQTTVEWGVARAPCPEVPECGRVLPNGVKVIFRRQVSRWQGFDQEWSYSMSLGGGGGDPYSKSRDTRSLLTADPFA